MPLGSYPCVCVHRCGHCKKLAPAWEELAQKLADEGHPTVIGAVDATIHKNLAVRFGVRGFPTLILVTDGKMFKYKGSRAVEDLEAFVKGGYKSSEGEPAPQQQTKLGKLAQQVVELFDSIVTLFKTQFAAALVMTALAFFTGLTIGFAGGLVLAPGAPKAPRRTPPPPPAAEPAINADSAKKHE